MNTPLPDLKDLLARVDQFWERVQKGAPDECWPWIGARSTVRNGPGYGSLRHDGRTQRAHRVAYTLTEGEIPAGLVICHRCDNPPCCNPAHLWLGTVSQNNADRASKGRTVRVERDESKVNRPRGETHVWARLTADQARAIRADTRPVNDVASDYSVNISTVSKIRLGRRWKHV